MKIPEFQLPSNKVIAVQLREATLEDAIEFSDVADGHDEMVTTRVLDTLQDKASFTPSKFWTGDDRRFALYWLWLNTTEEVNVPITFECSMCGKSHTHIINFLELADSYKNVQGKPERDIDFEDRKIIVKPLNGESLEAIELMVIARDQFEEGTKEYNLHEAKVRLMKFLHTIYFPEEKDEKEPQKYREKQLLKLSTSKFKKLANMVEEKLKEMEHGLMSMYHEGHIHLLTNEIPCPVKKGGGTVVRIPFRNIDYIPRI